MSHDPWIVYPGNLQGRSVRECGAKGAVVVEVADGRVESVVRLATDRARWADVVVAAAPCEDETALMRAVEEAVRPHAGEADGRMLAVRVSLSGESGLHSSLCADPDLRDKVEAAAQRCGDVWLEKLRVATSDPSRAGAALAPGELDLGATLGDVAADPALRAGLASLIASVRAKLPGGLTDEAAAALDPESILRDGQALALGRAERGVSP